MKAIRNLSLVVLGLVMGALLPSLTAQEATAPVPVVAPALDELGQAWLQTLGFAQARAQEACAQLPQTKDYDATRTAILRKVEARWPGYALDASKGALVAKPK